MAINIDHQQNKVSSESKTITFDQTGSIVMPKGTTTQRPSTPTQGAQRWNTSLNKVEFYDGSAWVSPQVLAAGTTYVTEDDALAFAIALGS
jgi:hypothetical protein